MTVKSPTMTPTEPTQRLIGCLVWIIIYTTKIGITYVWLGLWYRPFIQHEQWIIWIRQQQQGIFWKIIIVGRNVIMWKWICVKIPIIDLSCVVTLSVTRDTVTGGHVTRDQALGISCVTILEDGNIDSHINVWPSITTDEHHCFISNINTSHQRSEQVSFKSTVNLPLYSSVLLLCNTNQNVKSLIYWDTLYENCNMHSFGVLKDLWPLC